MRSLFVNHQTTFMDHPNKVSLIMYVRKCNWKCFGCHNMKHLIRDDEVKYISLEKIITLMNSSFYDLLIISGGECTLYDERILNDLKYIKSNTNKPVRLDSNGTNPKFLKYCFDNNIIDGVAIDVKYTYWNIRDPEKMKIITGIDNINCNDILESMKVSDGKEYSLFRTVKYPIFNQEDIDEITKYMKQFKSPHYFHNFYQL